MNILQLIDEPWDSGITNYALTISKVLADRGHKVIVGGLGGKPPILMADQMGLPAVMINFTDVNIFHLWHLVKSQKIQLINAHGGKAHTWAFLTLRAAFLKIPLVRTRGDIRLPRANHFSRYLHQKTDKIITAANFIKEAYINNLNIPANKIATIYQGIDTNIFNPQKSGDKFRQEFNIDLQTPLVGIVGRLDPIKGHGYFLRAARIVKNKIPKVKFVIVGKEENIKWKDLSDFAANLALEKDLIYTGFRKDISEIMAACQVGVIASIGSEAISRTAMEWLAVGKPVVATDVGCLDEIVKDQEVGFIVQQRDYEEMGQKILFLLENSAIASQMGEKAAQLVKEQFNLDVFATKTEQVYKEVLENFHR